MKAIYLDLGMGAAGDMLTAALYELLDENQKKDFINKMNSLGLPGVELTPKESVKCGITGTHMKVTVHGEEEESEDVDLSRGEHACRHDEHSHEHGDHTHHAHEHTHEHEEHTCEHGDPEMHVHNNEMHSHDHEHHHHHASMKEITDLIKKLELSDKVKTDAISIYELIAQAESHAHGKPVTEIHFHEVGTMDAVADVTAVCLLMEMLGNPKVYASDVHVGSGHVHCAHGILPVPAPATAFILQGVPVYGGSIKGELCTPTGAAILKHFVCQFGSMPSFRAEKYGYGMGKKDFEAVNCVRAMLGETAEKVEKIYEYSCNLDDITAEQIAFAIEELFKEGAVDAYTIPCGMKKSRPGLLLFAACHESDREKIIKTIFKHTTTLGMRETVSNRYFLERTITTLKTRFGDIRIKKAEGFGVKHEKYEYEDLARAARENSMSIQEIKDTLDRECYDK